MKMTSCLGSSRSWGWARDIVLVLAAVSSLVSPVRASQQPFLPVQTATAHPIVKRQPQDFSAGVVAKRQDCIPNFYSCASQGSDFAGVCCQIGQSCRLDESNSPACCPANAVCTGTAPASFVTPGPTKTAVSFVPNQYFSYPYIATYFDNPGDCSAAVTQCGNNYQACTTQLAGQGGFVVTIVVPGGGGTTITGGGEANLGQASATSICNSLSSVACHGLQLNMCTMTGTNSGGFYFGTGNVAARPTAACLGAVVAGVAGLAVMNGF